MIPAYLLAASPITWSLELTQPSGCSAPPSGSCCSLSGMLFSRFCWLGSSHHSSLSPDDTSSENFFDQPNVYPHLYHSPFSISLSVDFTALTMIWMYFIYNLLHWKWWCAKVNFYLYYFLREMGKVGWNQRARSWIVIKRFYLIR